MRHNTNILNSLPVVGCLTKCVMAFNEPSQLLQRRFFLHRTTVAHRTAAPTVAEVRAAFALLGVSPGASPRTVRSSYLQLARENHPDLRIASLSKQNEQNQPQQRISMTNINTAYETAQMYGHLLTQQENTKREGRETSQSETDEQRRAAADRRKQKQEKMKRVAWQQRSEYDWAAATHVTEQERAAATHHPYTYNKFFSFADDATIYRQLRAGDTPGQVARSLGKTVTAIQARVNNAQFKQRIRSMLRDYGSKGSTDPKHKFSRALGARPTRSLHHNPMSMEDSINGAVERSHRFGGEVVFRKPTDMSDDGWSATFAEDGVGQVQSAYSREISPGRHFPHFDRFHEQ